MVTNLTILKILRHIEKYLIKKTNFELGYNYDLILIVPSDSIYIEKYSWIISSKYLDNITQKDFISELINDFKKILTFDEYSSISRINKINSNHPLVKNIKFKFPTNDETSEVNDIRIGGIHINSGFIIHSKILEYIQPNKAVTFILQNNQSYKAGIISMNNQYLIEHYTRKGLDILYSHDRTEKEKDLGKEILKKGKKYLIENGYIDYTSLNDIKTVY